MSERWSWDDLPGFTQEQECKACGSTQVDMEFEEDAAYSGRDESYISCTCTRCNCHWNIKPRYLTGRAPA